MDRYDIADLLNGENLLSLDVVGLERVDISEITEGLLLHYEQLRQHGKDEYIEFLQREGRFNVFENEAAGLVAGYEIDPLKIRSIPENTLRAWLTKYIRMLSKGRRENERSCLARQEHKGIGW